MNRTVPLLAVLTLGCGAGTPSRDVLSEDLATDPGVQEDVPVPPPTYYHLEAHFWDGSDLFLDRDLSGKDPSTIYAFGSTHIAPAVSLAMTDTLYEPYAIVTINLGIVVGSDQYPVQCDQTGTYPFGSVHPPAVELYAKGLQYRSSLSKAQGSLEVTNWTTVPGEVFEGTFAGRLLFQTGQPDKFVDVKGSFLFTLPETAEGQ